MQILYIMCGVGFSGKSTLAKAIASHFGAALVSLDALYFEKEEEMKALGNNVILWEVLLPLCKERISALLESGQSVVFDNVNLTHAHRDELRALTKEKNAGAVVIFLNTPEALLTERQMKNKETEDRHNVEQHYLDEAKKQLEIPSTDERIYAFTPEMDAKIFIEQLPG